MGSEQDVRRRVRDTIASRGLIRPGQTVLAAVSGGADSVCLLHVLRTLRESLDFTLACAHVHHGLRGADADADAAFVESRAREWDLAVEVVRVDPKAWRVPGRSGEDAARAMRYARLAECARRIGAERIATGHTATDQAETVLMRIASGSGLTGLAGIKAAREDGVIRPLIAVSAADARACLTELGIAWREDATNASPAFDRNRVRGEVLPLLRERLNPRVDAALARLAEAARLDDEALAWFVDEAVGRLIEAVPGGEALPLPAYLALPDGARHRAVRALVARASGSTYALSREQVEALDRLAMRGAGGAVSLPRGFAGFAGGGWLTISNRDPSEGPAPGPVAIDGAGRYWFAESEVVVVAIDRVPERPWPVDTTYVQIEPGASLVLRTRQGGDRIAPEGMDGTKKVQDLFTDEKVPAGVRQRLPLLVCDADILWVCGIRRSRVGRAEPGASGALEVRIDNSGRSA